MTGILAIDTATEACSIAFWRDRLVSARHEITPRQHSRRLFAMLRELFPSGRLRDHGVDAIAWGCGPGSFTGLRIAASAVQGLAYTNELPVVAVSTLACQVQTARRDGLVAEGDVVLSTLDARIGEIYHGVYRLKSGLAVECRAPGACAPQALCRLTGNSKLVMLGSGAAYLDAFPDAMRDSIASVHGDTLPHAQDLIPLALEKLALGDSQHPAQVQPLYVRDEINWKKLPEQGKRS